jgi:hypothetical protein
MALKNNESASSTVVLLEDKEYFGARHVVEDLLSQETIGTT